jgi:exonuclease SbcC
MILKVRLRNWRSHKETELRFGDGTNVLVGGIGTGKSSVLDAIAYGLFGTLPGLKARKFKLEDLITSVPRKEPFAEVEITFRTPDEEEYIVKRRIERGKGTVLAELRRSDGSLVEEGSERVNEHVCELLKITYDVYERAIYSEQNQLDMFLEIKKGRRRESIDELLGIKRYEKARKNIGTIANHLQKIASEKERELQVLKQDRALELARSLEEEIQKLTEEAESEEKKAAELLVKLKSARSDLDRMKETEKRIAALQSERSAILGSMKELKNQVESLKAELGEVVAQSLATLKERIDELLKLKQQKTRALQELEEKKSKLEGGIGRLEGEVRSLRQKNDELRFLIRKKADLIEELKKAPLTELERELERQKRNGKKIGEELAVASSRLGELERALQELQEAKAECPVCETPLDDRKKNLLQERRKKEIENTQRRIQELEIERKQIEERIARIERQWKEALLKQKELESLEEKEEELQKSEAELANKNSELEELKKKKAEVDSLVSTIRNELEEVEIKLLEAQEKAKAKQKMEESSKRLRALEEKLVEVSSRLSELERVFSPEELRKKEQALQELSSAYARTQELAVNKRRLAEEKRKRLDEIKKKLVLIERLGKEVETLRGLSQLMSALQQATSRVQIELRRYFLDSVNEVMNDVWRELYPYADFTGIRLHIDEEANDYVLQLRDLAGNWRAVDGGVSGGERSTACLALRVAFAMVLAPNLRWIVFDEPTHNLDVRGVEELARVLRERLPQIVRQVLLITHDEKLEEAVSGFLYRFYREKGENQPTQCELVTGDLYVEA